MELHKKTQTDVQQLLDETGHVLSLSDIADVLELNEIAKRITGKSGDYADLISWPVKCGNLLLRPLTIGKMSWYNKRALAWFNDDVETLATVLAFLLSVDNTESFVWGMNDAQTAKDAIEQWERNLDVTPAELAAAVALAKGESSAAADSDSPDDYGPLVSLLCREYGNTPRYWIYEESINVIRALMDDYTRRINQQIQHNNRSAGKGKKAVAPIKTPAMDAMLAFRKKLESLRVKWTAKHDG